MPIHCECWSDVKFEQYYRELVFAVAASSAVTRVCEIGGGANPLLSLDEVARHALDYTILDLSEEELAKAPAGYQKICGDVTADELPTAGDYDLVFSHMVAEHVRDGEQFHRNIFRLLAPGGTAVHLFPTLYALPFTVNRFLPESVTKKLLLWVMPWRTQAGQNAKFPAYYHWCRGPRKSQLRRLERLGYEIEEYVGIYGHGIYYRRAPLLRWLHQLKSKLLAKYPLPIFTSFAVVKLRKPVSAS